VSVANSRKAATTQAPIGRTRRSAGIESLSFRRPSCRIAIPRAVGIPFYRPRTVRVRLPRGRRRSFGRRPWRPVRNQELTAASAAWGNLAPVRSHPWAGPWRGNRNSSPGQPAQGSPSFGTLPFMLKRKHPWRRSSNEFTCPFLLR
jgi:hypothetical protein